MSVSRDHYYALASEVDSERIAAATKLLQELAKADIAAEWDYALNRLIKGLTTSRQSARFGFSMALTELVRELVSSETHALTVSSFLDRVVESSVVSASMKGKDVRSTLFGRLFGFQALVNSQLMFEPQHSSTETLQKFVKLLVELSGAKAWLRETAMYTLCQFMGAYLQSPFAADEVTTSFLQTISDEGLTFTTEGVAVVLTIPAESRARIVAGVSTTRQWKHGDPMARGNLPVLAKVLKDVDAEDPAAAENAEEAADDGETAEKKADKSDKGKQAKQKGTWSPRLPFVWDLLVQHFVAAENAVGEDGTGESADGSGKKRKKNASSSSKKRAKLDQAPVEAIPFKEFWKVAVDDTLFADKSSAERKYWGFEIFNKFVAALPGNMVTHLFTPNLMRCLINQSAQSGRLLNKISTKTINTIIETSQADLSKVVPCLNAVTDDARGGSWKIDQLTKSKLCDALVGVLAYLDSPETQDFGSVEKVVQQISQALIAKFNAALHAQKDTEAANGEEQSKKKSNDSVLKWVLDKLLVLFRSTKRYSAAFTSSLEDAFKFLLQHAFFRAKDDAGVVSENVLKLVQDRLNSFLAEFISSRRKEHSWSLYCVKQIEKLERRGELELVSELSAELGEIKNECFAMLDTIKQAMKHKHAKSDQYCFELLFSMNLLQLYMGETETVSVLEDLKVSYAEIFGANDEDIDTAVVLTEILLSFVSRKSTLLKKLSAIVWESYMCAEDARGQLHINENCFKLLFDVLGSSENEEGQKRLFEGEAEYRGDEESGEEGSHNEGSEESEEEEESDAESDSASEDSAADGAKTVEMVEKETKIKLANALGIKGDYDGEVKYEDIDSEDDDQYESESMDDEQMMAIDGELAKIFKERRSALTANSTSKKNSEQVMAKEQMLLFKNRVLDLLESFSKVQPNSIHNVSFLRPLVHVINTTKDKNLGVKAHKLLKTRISKVKFSEAEVAKVYSDADDVAAFKKTLLELVQWLQFQAGAYSSSQSHGAACAQACIVASKCLLVVDAGCLPEIIQIYAATLTKWATEPKNRIQAGLFFDFVNWLSTKRAAPGQGH